MGASTTLQPTAFLVRYSPGWPITAPLDYVGPGSATSQGRCTAVAIGAGGSYAVGQQAGAGGRPGRGAHEVLTDHREAAARRAQTRRRRFARSR